MNNKRLLTSLNKAYFIVFAAAVIMTICAAGAISEVEIASERSVDEAYSLYDSGDYQGALEYALEMISNNNDVVNANIVAAESSLELGNTDGTIDFYKKALEIEPDNFTAMQGLGEVYFGTGRKEEANEVFLNAIEKYPDAVELYNYSAHVYRDAGQLESAVSMLEKSISIDPLFSEAYLNLGTTYIMMSEYKKSVEYLEKAVELDTMSYTAYNNLSLAYYRMGEYEKALEAIENAIKLSPGDKKVLKNLTYLAEEIEKIKPDYIEFDTGAKEAPLEDIELERNASNVEISGASVENGEEHISENIYWEDSRRPSAYVKMENSEPEAAAETLEGTKDPLEEGVQEEEIVKTEIEIQQSETTQEDIEAIVTEQAEINFISKSEADDTTTVKNSNENTLESHQDGMGGKTGIKNVQQSDVEKSKQEMTQVETTKETAQNYVEYVPYNPPAIDALPMVEKVTLPVFEGGLEPLPLPESIQTGGVEIYDDEVISIGRYSASELAKKRKKLQGILYFSDGDKMLWRYHPAKNAMQKMFKGIYPSCSREGDRLLYVTWDLHNVKLYLYDFPSSSRSIILTSERLIRNPKFSPDGKFVAYQIMTGSYKNKIEVISLTDLSRKEFPAEIDDPEFDWRPDSNTLVAIDEKCEDLAAKNRADLCLYEWKVESDEVTQMDVNIQMEKNKRIEIGGKKKIKFTNDSSHLLVFPASEGYFKYYDVDLKNGATNENGFAGEDGKELRIWNLSTGYDEGTYVWTFMGNIWGESPTETRPFEILIGRFVSSSVAWCPEP